MNRINFFRILLVLVLCFHFSFSNTRKFTSLEESIKLLRLDYQTPSLYESQILLGFMNDMATDGIDPGYDAVSPNNYPNQFYFKSNGYNLIIQGVGYFTGNQTFPLGITTNENGTVKIKVNSHEGFENTQNFYIYDNLTSSYHDIKNGIFEVYLNQGVHENRFTLTFSNTASALNSNSFISFTDFSSFLTENNILTLHTNLVPKKIEIYGINGQKVAELVSLENNIVYDVSSFSKGVYIVNVIYDNGLLSKKIILQ